jgi:hypothetical protein
MIKTEQFDISAIPKGISQQFQFSQLRKGIECPTCERFIKINRKKLNKTMLQYLVALFHEHGNKDSGWVKASRIRIKAETDLIDGLSVQTGDYKILALWSLVELHPTNPGMVRISSLGMDFLNNKIKVRESVLLENYKNRFVSFDGDNIDVFTVGGTRFLLTDL